MKKLLLAALLPWLCLVLLQAQDRPLPEKLRHLYAPLDKTRVPTGYLWDQSLCLASPGNYQGQLDTFYANPDVFGMFYGALRNSYVGKPDGNLPVPSVYLNSIKTPPTDGAIPLALMAMQYDRIRPDAFSSHLLAYNGTQVQELPNQ